MRRHVPALVLCAALATGLSSCAAVPEPELQVWQHDAHEFVEAAASEGDSLGAGSITVGEQDPPPDEDEDGGVILTYPSPVHVDGITVACFGEGAVRFGYFIRTGSSWTGSESVDVLCDGAETELLLAERVDAVRFNAVLANGSGAVMAAAISGAAE